MYRSQCPYRVAFSFDLTKERRLLCKCLKVFKKLIVTKCNRLHCNKIIVTKVTGTITLQTNFVTSIKERRKIERLFTKFPSLKVASNKLTSELRLNLKEFWNQIWLELKMIGKNPLSRRPTTKTITI
ncbi:hypothetical protein BpHYR1_034314 [Brachionus plicatilis]|uniref:RNA-directed DNA polymerase from mobile element jockey-like n=1 Tax=Brachionus plicatilis TaxID=10195 RepID=A0A3M7RUS8_BRAPC|nr:hypothetical protein BpHYR1_034314 [Brachionus plicatilis]